MRFESAAPSPAAVRVARAGHLAGTFGSRVRRAVRGYASVGRFASRGDDFDFDPDGTYSYESIHVGDHVNLGSRPTLLATRSEIRIGSHVMFGPGVTVRGGNHRFDLVGRFMDSVGEDEKRPQDDRGVVIEDDVWVGGNATILGGVRVGRGSVIAASSVVAKDVPPYSVVGGNPARVLRERFTRDEIAAHEAQLGLRPLA